MRLVGIKATTITTGKNEGKTGYTYSFMKEYTDYEKESSHCNGYAVTTEFSYKQFDVTMPINIKNDPISMLLISFVFSV